MLNMQEVSATIEELENGNTTLEACRRLAALYIVREYNKNRDLTGSIGCTDGILEEYHDILPSYSRYCTSRKQFQLLEAPKEKVVASLKTLCDEIGEFLSLLYTSTESTEERELIEVTIGSLSFLKKS